MHCLSNPRATRWNSRHRMVHQVLHEHAASLSAATHANRSRRLIKCAKDSGHYPCALSAKAARALNRAALETNCRTFRFHSSTSQRTKSPLCSEPRARPALGRRFKLSWQSPSPITFCVFSNTSSFTAAIRDYIGLQAIALYIGLQAIALKRPINRSWPR